MSSINLVKVRASITIGTGLTVVTPNIQSFNVRKSRGQLSSFDATLKIPYSSSPFTGNVEISAGVEGNIQKIFTGIIKKASMSPCWDDPGFILLSISGTDVLSLLEGKRFTRRCRSTKATWVAINSVEREGLRDGKFTRDIQTLIPDGGKALPTNELIANPPKYTAVGEPPKTPADKPIFVKVIHLGNSNNLTPGVTSTDTTV